VHRFLGRYVLARHRIADFRSMEIGTGWGAKLIFCDGSAIRFIGAHISILQKLREHLEQTAPKIARFD
jgi:hypothetical protein